MRPEIPRYALVVYRDKMDIGCLPFLDAATEIKAGRAILIAKEDEELCYPIGHAIRVINEQSNPKRAFDTDDSEAIGE